MKDANYPSIKEQLTERKGLLQEAVKVSPGNQNLSKLLNDVDAALKEMAEGKYGICKVYAMTRLKQTVFLPIL